MYRNTTRSNIKAAVAAFGLLAFVGAGAPAFAEVPVKEGQYDLARAGARAKDQLCPLAAAAVGGAAGETAKAGMSSGGAKPAPRGGVGAVVTLVVFSGVNWACQKLGGK